MGGVTKVIKKVVKTVAKVVSNVFSGITKAIGSIFGGAFGLQTPDVGSVDAGYSADGVKVTKTGSNNPIPVIYGQRRVGGSIIFAETNGNTNTYLYVSYAIAEAPCFGPIELYVDGTKIDQLSADKMALERLGVKKNYNITTGKYANRLQVEFINGNAASTLLGGSKSWNNKTRQFPNLFVINCRYEWKKIESQADQENNPYNGGIPQIEAVVKGKMVWSPTYHQGTGADANHQGTTLTYDTLQDRAEDYYSIFGPAHLFDYLTNTRYGCGIPLSEIDAYSFKIAEDKAAKRVFQGTSDETYAHLNNTVLNTNTKLLQNVKLLLSSFRGFMPYVEGRYKLNIEDAGHPYDITNPTPNSVMTLDEDNIVGSIGIAGERKEGKYNKVIVRFADADTQYSENQGVYEDATAKAQDGEDLVGTFEMRTITSLRHAYNMAKWTLLKSRNQRHVTFNGTPDLLELVPGDIFTLNNEILQITNQTYRVTQLNINPDGTVGIQAREHNASDFPYTINPTIASAPGLFKPQLGGVPVPRPIERLPYSIRPPVLGNASEDPLKGVVDFDSAGDPVRGTFTDFLLESGFVTIKPAVYTGVNRYVITDGSAENNSPLLDGVEGYPDGTGFKVSYIFRYQISRASLRFKYLRPSDQTVEFLEVRSYNRNEGGDAFKIDRIPINHNKDIQDVYISYFLPELGSQYPFLRVNFIGANGEFRSADMYRPPTAYAYPQYPGRFGQAVTTVRDFGDILNSNMWAYPQLSFGLQPSQQNLPLNRT